MSDPAGLAAASREPPPGDRPRYGPFARWVLGWLFGPVEFPAEAAGALRELARRATLVYVLRSSALLHLVYLNFRFDQLGLPLARAATGLGYRIFAPFARWYLGGDQVRPPQETPLDRATATVVEAARSGESAVVFLRLPRTLPSAVARLADPFPALVSLQRRAGPEGPPRPIALVPLTLLWSRQPRQLSRGLRDVLFGDPEEPGALRAFIGFLLHRRTTFVKVGAPVELSRELTPAPDERIARRVRGFLHQHLSRQSRVVTGPPLKSPQRVADETLRDLTLRRTLAAIARERGRADDSVDREARRCLREIAARYNRFAVDVLRKVLGFVFTRIYDGIDVDEEGMREVLAASAKGALVLCPSHKSHIDYMILPLVCDQRGLSPPHVAAGDNLNFWPVGRLLRMGGAFFIRRSFKGDRVYAATLAAYVKRLVRDGFTQEFFIEGGRSRTGKLLPPKFGMLAMEVDAWLASGKEDLWFCPVSISYERMVEGQSYQRELLGGEKPKEDAKALLSATRVLRGRYGRIAIRFDRPLSLARHFQQRGVDPRAHHPEALRALVSTLGWQVAAGINRVAPLAPLGLCAAALLSHDLRALSEDEVLTRAEFLHRAALDAGARTPAWGRPEEARAAGLPPDLRRSGLLQRALQGLVRDGAVRSMAAGGERFYSVPEELRLAIDYHKNSIVHFLVAPAILASALRSFAGQGAALSELLLRAKDLSRLLKHEFIYEPGRPFDAVVEENFQLLLRWGVAEARGAAGAVEVLPVPSGVRELRLLSDLLRPFCEGVWVAASALPLLLRGPLEAREWSRTALDRGRAAYLAGRLRRIESLTKATLENATATLRGRGILEAAETSGSKLVLAPAWRRPEALAQLPAEADLFLR